MRLNAIVIVIVMSVLVPGRPLADQFRPTSTEQIDGERRIGPAAEDPATLPCAVDARAREALLGEFAAAFRNARRIPHRATTVYDDLPGKSIVEVLPPDRARIIHELDGLRREKIIADGKLWAILPTGAEPTQDVLINPDFGALYEQFPSGDVIASVSERNSGATVIKSGTFTAQLLPGDEETIEIDVRLNRPLRIRSVSAMGSYTVIFDYDADISPIDVPAR